MARGRSLQSGVSSLGMSGVPWHPQILEDQLTRGADYAHQIILAPPDFQTFIRPCNSHRVDVTESSSAQLSILFSIFDHMGSKGNFFNFELCF